MENDLIINECEEFPNSEHDDIVDSISQFLNYAKSFANSFEQILVKQSERKKFY
jgi:phage terminase large subunit-like protein